MTLAVVCYLYRGPDPRGAVYCAEHVNILRRMVARHLTVPHDFWCVGDDPVGLDPEVKFHPCAADLLPLGGCYVKLQMWRRDAAAVFGDRILLIDLDTVIVGDIDPLAARTEDVVLWRDPLFGRAAGWLYNAGMILMSAGARPHVWERFDPERSPGEVERSGLHLHEQAWIGMQLGPSEAVFTAADGVLSFKFDGVSDRGLPEGARIVFFTGRPKPWEVAAAGVEWVRRHYW